MLPNKPIATDRLQRLVDSLAQRLSLAVLVDDPALRPLAYSAQGIDSVDRVRAVSILNREAPSAVVEHLFDQGIEHAEGPVKVAANEELGLARRVCSPVREGGQTLGYLWVIDDGAPVGTEEIELIRQIAEGAAPLLRTGSLRHRQHQVEARVDELLGSDVRLSCDAAADLLDAQEFSSSAHAAVMVAKVIPPPGERVDETVAVLLSRGLHAFGRGIPARHLLSLSRDDHAVVVVGAEEPGVLDGKVAEMGRSLRDRIAAAAPDDRWVVSVGIGSPVRSLAGASRSYVQAAQAAGVAGRLTDVDPVLEWSEMGIYRLLAPPPDAGFDLETLPPGIMLLLEHPGGEMLLHTLETYLDHGGDAQATTAELFLARGSLYYRLHRIEEIAEVSLRSGHDRLMLHVGLKLARICGLYPTVDAAPGAMVEAAV